jgi:hypothetical protein
MEFSLRFLDHGKACRFGNEKVAADFEPRNVKLIGL